MTDHGREVRSPNSLSRDTPHPRRGETASMHRGPFADRRADSGLGTGAVPVQGMPTGVVPDRGRRG